MVQRVAKKSTRRRTARPGRGDGLSDGDREHAIELLQKYLDGHALRRVVDSLDIGIETVVASARSRSASPSVRLRTERLAEYLVDLLGRDLLACRELRYELARAASNLRVRNLHRYNAKANVNISQERKAQEIADRKWHAGGPWAQHFASKLGFRSPMAGEVGLQKPPDTELVIPAYPLPDLLDFQKETAALIRERLDGPVGANRAFLSLPTGAGKTRTAVDAVLGWWHERDRPGVVMWIAQNEELCEQAVASFAQTWQHHALAERRRVDRRGALQIHRLWGSRALDDVQPGDVVVAGIQQLDAIRKRDQDDPTREALDRLADDLAVVLIDEAHSAMAPSYRKVLEHLGIKVARGASAEIPLIGISATPFRSDQDETRRLVRRFEQSLVVPQSLGEHPIEELQRRRVLSRTTTKLLQYDHRPWSMRGNRRWLEHFEQFGDLHPELVAAIASDRARNHELVKVLKKLARRTDSPALLFAATVAHAEAMCVLLRGDGLSAACVTGTTRPAVRRRIIDEFRSGRINVLCNHGVLTTGFDAPRVRSMVIARPTASPVLYEQMVGRGLRGKKFGGTPTCEIYDVLDHLDHGSVMSWTRYEHMWAPAARRNEPRAA